MSTMKVLICQKIKSLIWKIRERPVAGDDEALIKIKAVGICGTDIHAWAGNQPFFSYPRVLGHEICGEIIDAGKNIHNFNIGQQVAVIPYISCQQCPACKVVAPTAVKEFQSLVCIRMVVLVSIWQCLRLICYPQTALTRRRLR